MRCGELAGNGRYLKMINPPKTPEELYKFFTGIAKPPVNSHVAYIGGTPYLREGWMIYAYRAKPSNTYSLWFHYKESEPAKWFKVYREYYENDTTYKH